MSITYQRTNATNAPNATDTSGGAGNQTCTLPTHATGDMLLAFVGTKFYTGNTWSTVSTSTSGWETNKAEAETGQVLATATADSGDVKADGWWKEAASSSETSPVINYGDNYSPTLGNAAVFSKAANETWSVSNTAGADTDPASTSISITGGSNLGFTAGDMVAVAVFTPNDAAALNSYTITISGCSVDTDWSQKLSSQGTTTGSDMSIHFYAGTITSGTSSGAPVFAATTAASGYAEAAAIFYRLHVSAAHTRTSGTDFTENGCALTETLAHSVSYAKSDNLALTDSNVSVDHQGSGTAHEPTIPADPCITTDGSVARNYNIAVNDCLDVLDQYTIEKTIGGTAHEPTIPADTAGLTGTVALNRTCGKSDSLPITDSVKFDITRVLSDLLNSTEQTSKDYSVSYTDTLPSTDAQIKDLGTLITFSSNTNLTDGTGHYAIHETGSDPICLSDFTTVELETTTGSNWTRTPDSMVSLADARTYDQAYVKSNTASLTDNIVVSHEIVKSDSLGLTDSAAVSLGIVLSKADTATLTDSPTVTEGVEQTNSNDEDLTDSITIDRNVTIGDSLGLTDTRTYEHGKSDLASLTDSVVFTLTKNISFVDVEGETDNQKYDAAYVKSNSTGLTDSALVENGKLITFTNSVTITDTRTQSLEHSVVDNQGLSDSHVLDKSRALTDNADITDNYTVSCGSVVTYTDSMDLTDSHTFGIALVFADSTGLTDARTYARPYSTTDNTGLTDAYFVDTGFTVYRTETESTTDTYSLVWSRLNDYTDSTGLTDSATYTRETSQTQSNNINITDSVQFDISVQYSHIFNITEQTSLEHTLDVDDAASLTDTSTVSKGYILTLSNDQSLTDTRTQDVAVSRSDALGTTDAYTIEGAGVKRIDSVCALTDAIVIVRDSTIDSTETITDSGLVKEHLLTGTDSIGPTDTFSTDKTTAQQYERTGESTANLTDAAILEIGLIRIDELNLTDSTQTSRGLAIPQTDLESISSETTFTREPGYTDPASLTDAVTLSLGRNVSVVDNTLSTDTITYAHAHGHIDTQVTTDSITYDRSIVFVDSLPIQTNESHSASGSFTTTNLCALTDTVSISRTMPRDQADSLTLHDSPAISLGRPRTDNTGLTDRVTLEHTLNRSDSANLTDAATPARTHPEGATEAANLTDTFIVAITRVVATVDVEALTDETSITAVIILEFVDVLSLTEYRLNLSGLAPYIKRNGSAKLRDYAYNAVIREGSPTATLRSATYALNMVMTSLSARLTLTEASASL